MVIILPQPNTSSVYPLVLCFVSMKLYSKLTTKVAFSLMLTLHMPPSNQCVADLFSHKNNGLIKLFYFIWKEGKQKFSNQMSISSQAFTNLTKHIMRSVNLLNFSVIYINQLSLDSMSQNQQRAWQYYSNLTFPLRLPEIVLFLCILDRPIFSFNENDYFQPAVFIPLL